MQAKTAQHDDSTNSTNERNKDSNRTDKGEEDER